MLLRCHVCDRTTFAEDIGTGWRTVSRRLNGGFHCSPVMPCLRGAFVAPQGTEVVFACGPHHALILFERYLDHTSFTRQPSTEPDDASQSAAAPYNDEHYISHPF